MALYLQMDGVDDYIKTPSITFNKMVMDFKARQLAGVTRTYFDFRTGFSFGYLQRLSNGTDTMGNDGQMDVYVDGVNKPNNTIMIPYDTRITLDTRWTVTATDDAVFFANSGNSPNSGVAGDIYDIKFYNGATLVAHYNMSTGTVQDQSGNNRHATLTGGTWLDDGTGSTGTDVSVSYATKNVIYHESENPFSSKQQVYADQIQLFDSKLVQYKDDARNYNTKQVISKELIHSYSTKQIITLVGGKEVHTVFPTKQQIYSVRSDVFATRQELKGRFYKTLNLYTSSQSEIKLDTSLGDTVIEIVSYMGQTVYQPNTLRTVSEMEVIV